MATKNKANITIEVNVNSSIEKVWDLWTIPFHILHWNAASDDWQTTIAENDLTAGGRFSYRMEAKDGSFGFDYWGDHNLVEKHSQIESTLGDGRKISVKFTPERSSVRVTETFETEDQNNADLQRKGWLAILQNFKKYAENYQNFELLHFEVSIAAPSKKVMELMLEEKTYKAWTSAFNPTSEFKGSWSKSSKILFLGTDSDGKTGGMVSRIKENIPGKFLSIEHLGIVKDGSEVLTGPESETLKGSLENYSFVEKDGKTLLSVDVDTAIDFRSYFLTTWPKALEKIRSLCEA